MSQTLDRKLKKLVLKTKFLKEELYDIEEEFDRRSYELRRAIIELLARAGELIARPTSQSEAPADEGQKQEGDAENIQAPAWQKKLYRKIAAKTHPDALLRDELSEKERVERLKMMIDASRAIEKRDGVRLLEIAAELDLDVDEVPLEEHVLGMEKHASDLERRMGEIKQMAGWAWGDVNDAGKLKILAHTARVSGWSGNPDHLPVEIISWVSGGMVDGIAGFTPPPPEPRKIRSTRKIGERPQKPVRNR
jgi:hypothetical protein